MPVTLTSLQRWGPLHVPLSGGGSLRLAPSETKDVQDVDVQDNPKIEKLRRLGLLEVTPVRTPGRTKGGRPGDAPPPERRGGS